MSYHLVFYGNETLRKIAGEVTCITGETIELIRSMFTVMRKERGIGLAGPQVDVSQRLLVVDLESYNGPSLALINPVIMKCSEETSSYEEGCLSVPGIMSDIIRPASVHVKAITPEEKEIEIEAEGLLARVLQHEIDHLNGKLFIDYMEDYRRRELTGELKKIKKLNRTR